MMWNTSQLSSIEMSQAMDLAEYLVHKQQTVKHVSN